MQGRRTSWFACASDALLPTSAGGLEAWDLARDGHRLPEERAQLVLGERVQDVLRLETRRHVERLGAVADPPRVAVASRRADVGVMKDHHHVGRARGAHLHPPVETVGGAPLAARRLLLAAEQGAHRASAARASLLDVVITGGSTGG